MSIHGFFLCLSVVSLLFIHSDGKRTMPPFKGLKHSRHRLAKVMRMVEELDVTPSLDSSNTDPYVSSPFTLPPFESLPPFPLPENSPPLCVYPPATPSPPSVTVPTTPGGSSPILPPFYIPPIIPIQNPPPSPTGPPVTIPSPPIPVINPPFFEPSPPTYTIPSPPFSYVPVPGGRQNPPTFKPPVVFPPPFVPPPPHSGPSIALWCVANPSVPDPIIQEAMNYACGSGADCEAIQQDGTCFEPNTLFAHASYAFNSYWQRTKVAGGTCSFGGTAMLVTVDPSNDGCHFVYS